MQDFKKSIEFYSDEMYHDLAYGTIYYVPGTSSYELDEYVSAHADQIADRLNNNEHNWVTCHIICIAKDNPLFAPHRNAALYSAMLPMNDTPAGTYGFLMASLDSTQPAMVESAISDYFDTLQQMFDEILNDDDNNDEIRFSGAARMMNLDACCPHAVGRLEKAKSAGIRREVHFDQPSRLEITPNTFQVLLPDYHREIRFNAQIKALYVLFLNHPEGIRMKEIGDHKAEFKKLYFYFSNRSNTDQLRDAVERLFDVYSPNALNVKKSQCSEQLKLAIPEDYLRQYYEIEVHRGEPHKINLDRALVSMPDFLQQR